MKADEIIVRKATIRDVGGIIDVLKSTKLAEEPWRGKERLIRESLQESLNNRNYTIFVAEFDREIVGFIDYIVFDSFWECTKQGMINHLFVHGACQGKGVGAKLIKAVVEHGDAIEIGEMHVSTEWENVKARNLYRKHGFTEERLLLERSQEVK